MSVILIVDDTPINVKILAEALKEGNEIRVTTDPHKAFELAKKNPIPDLILLDVVMPELSGYDVIKQLKKDPETALIPVIFVTAKTDVEDESKGLELGAVDYITKPFQLPVIMSRVKTQIQIKKYAEELREQNKLHKQLIHILCHDLRNPIGALSNYIDLLIEDKSLLNNILGNMNICAKNTISIIDDIHKYMAAKDNKNTLNVKKHALIDIVKESTPIVQNMLSKKNISLNVNIDSHFIINVDKTTFINSVIVNLLTNAIKFSYQNSSIEITARKNHDILEIHIRDHGIGIPEKVLENIFNIEKSHSMPGTQGEQGTGFGMPLVYKFVKTFDGDIKIHSFQQEKYPEEHGTDIVILFKYII